MSRSPLPEKMFEPTVCIPTDLLMRYSSHSLEASEVRKVEEHLADCDLCAGAVEGFLITAVSAADLETLHSRIDSLSGASWFSSLGFKTGLIIVVVSIFSLGLWFANKGEGNSNQLAVNSGPQTKLGPQQEQIMPSVSAPVENSLNTRIDNFQEPAKHVPSVKEATSFQTGNSKENAAKAMKEEVAVSHAPLPDEQKPVDSKVSAAVEEVAVAPKPVNYNRSLQYINTLKISDFDHLYRTVAKQLGTPDHHVPANQEGGDAVEVKDGLSASEHVQSVDIILRRGLAAFKDASYEPALGAFKQLIDLNPKDINSLFYSGMCYYWLNKPSRSIALFDQVLGMDNNAFAEEASWYKAEALQALGKREEAKALLEKISTENGFYAKEAREKLK